MSTSTYYNFIGPIADHDKQRPTRTTQDMNQIDQHRQAAISPASFATSSSDSSSSLNSQFNSLTLNGTPASSSTTTCSSSLSSSSTSSSSSSSSSSTTSTTNLVNPTSNQALSTTTAVSTSTHRSLACHQRDLMRQSSTTPTQVAHHSHLHHSPSQLIHSHTLHSLEPKSFKPFKSRSAYIDAMKEDIAEWLNSIYSDLDLTPENFFSQLETGAIICRHANNVTQMGRNLMIDQTAASSESSSNSDNENNSLNHESSLNSQQNSLSSKSSPSPDQDEQHQHHHGRQHLANGHTFTGVGRFNHRHRNSTTNSSISSISTTTSSSAGRQRLSLTGSTSFCSRSSNRVIDWFRVKVIPYKADAKPGTFFARDNICQFILWCRSLNILECLLFETDDLVARKNEKSFILCLLEVARLGFKVGMPTPLIIQLEQEIDREIENDAKLQKQLEEESAQKIRSEMDHFLASYLNDDDDNGYVDSNDNEDDDDDSSSNKNGLKTSVKRHELNNNDNDDDDNHQREEDVLKASSKQQDERTNMAQDDDDGELNQEDIGPKPQVITNDLLSLHEKVVQLLCQCTCPTQFPMVRIGDGKYKVGDKLIIFVRILRRHIMVRVGGGWQELSEFLRQKDPCRTKQHHQYFGHQHSASKLNSSLLAIGPATTTPTMTAAAATTTTIPPPIAGTSVCSIPVSRSRLVGSSHHLNKSYIHNYKSGSQRLISGSASMSWLSHN